MDSWTFLSSNTLLPTTYAFNPTVPSFYRVLRHLLSSIWWPRELAIASWGWFAIFPTDFKHSLLRPPVLSYWEITIWGVVLCCGVQFKVKILFETINCSNQNPMLVSKRNKFHPCGVKPWSLAYIGSVSGISRQFSLPGIKSGGAVAWIFIRVK